MRLRLVVCDLFRKFVEETLKTGTLSTASIVVYRKLHVNFITTKLLVA